VSGSTLAHTGGVNYVRFTNTGTHFVTGGQDGTTKLWTQANNFSSATQTLPYQTVSGGWTKNTYEYALG
jgi:WD40 repeat protein